MNWAQVIDASTTSTRAGTQSASEFLNFPADPTGLPARNLIEQSMSWLSVAALWASLASLLLGAIFLGLGVLGSSGNSKGLGKSLIIGGVIGALIVGLAPTVVNELYKAGQQA
jgi:uncharacterized membrane protein YkvI